MPDLFNISKVFPWPPSADTLPSTDRILEIRLKQSVSDSDRQQFHGVDRKRRFSYLESRSELAFVVPPLSSSKRGNLVSKLGLDDQVYHNSRCSDWLYRRKNIAHSNEYPMFELENQEESGVRGGFSRCSSAIPAVPSSDAPERTSCIEITEPFVCLLEQNRYATPVAGLPRAEGGALPQGRSEERLPAHA